MSFQKGGQYYNLHFIDGETGARDSEVACQILVQCSIAAANDSTGNSYLPFFLIKKQRGIQKVHHFHNAQFCHRSSTDITKSKGITGFRKSLDS